MNIAEQLSGVLSDHYRVEREIGRGGMASVFLAQDLRLDRPVALKVLKPELAATLGATRFLTEIRVTAHLQHPNLLPLFDSGDADGLLYYVMPYVDGETLRSRLTRERQLPIHEAVHIASTIASALEYAHAHGIIHRDLKPENILLQGGEPMVADFGIALAVSRAGGERITNTGMQLGTPSYMSPEQAIGDPVVDARTDIYSLAAVLFEMLTGEPPHRGGTAQATIARVLTENAPSVRVMRPRVPQYLADVVARGLEKRPADRWLSARAFCEALSGGDRLPEASARPSAGGRWRAHAPPRLLALAGVATLAGLAVSFSVVVLRGDGPRSPLARLALDLPDSLPPFSHVGKALALSPSGGVLAYVGGVRRELLIRPLSDLVPRAVPGTEGADCPAFSPDGRWIVFTAGGRVMKVALEGGSPFVLASSGGSCAVWTDRDEVVFDSLNHSIHSVSANGGPPRLVVAADSAQRLHRIRPSQALPGGRDLLVSYIEDAMHDWQIGVLSLTTGRVTKITGGDGTPRHAPIFADGRLLYVEDGSLFATPFSLRSLGFSGAPIPLLRDTIVTYAVDGARTLAYVSTARMRLDLVAADLRGRARVLRAHADGLPGDATTWTTMDTAFYSWPRLSPDGRRVAIEVRSGPTTWDVWVYDLASHTLSRLTSNFSGIRPMGWTPDGRSIIYMAVDTPYLEAPQRLVAQRWDGSSPPEEIMRLPASVHDVTIAAAQRRVALTILPRGRPSGIWLTSLDSPAVIRPLLNSGAPEEQPRFSPDGRLLAYVTHETGPPQVYVQPASGARRLQVSAGAGHQPVWSADGRYLFYRGPLHMMRAAIASGTELTLLRRDTLFEDVYARSNYTNFDVFPGGRELLMIRAITGAPRTSVVLNWPELIQ